MGSESLLELCSEEEAIIRELIRRGDARSSLAEYGRYLNPYTEFPDFQLEMIGLLEKVERGEIKRLIINMPPRFGKSFWVSQYFIAWYISRNPKRKIMHASYSAAITTDFGREIRNILKSDESAQLFDVRLRQDSHAASRFHSTNGCHYYAVGVLGSITGRGCHLLVMEDPTNANDADNSRQLQKCFDRFRGTIRSRLEPNAAIVIVMQRLSLADISGRLIDEMKSGGETWTVLNVPAINKDGESNFPTRWPLEALEETRKGSGPKVWAAQYMQDPAAGDGEMFKAMWFEDKYIDAANLPEGLRMVRAWDRAATKVEAGKDPDYSVGMLLGRSRTGITYIIDVIRFRDTPLNNEIKTRQAAKADGIRVHIVQEQEPGSSGKTTISHYKRNVVPEYRFIGIPATRKKTSRAEPVSGQCQDGHVYIVRNPAWNPILIAELCAFPYGPHDDQADALSLGYNYLAGRSNILDKMGAK
jgi:predicted phage terminase large subunit-like protein